MALKLRPIAPAAGVMLLVAVVDLALGSSVSLLPLLVLGPLLAAAMTGPAPTAWIGAVAVVIAIAIAGATDMFDERRFYVGVGTVLAGAVLAPILSASAHP